MADTLYLIDGHATLYRAYFAIKTRLSAPGTGMPTNAAFGFTRIVLALRQKDQPKLLAATFDSVGPTFRHEIYEKYKCSRPSMPDDLRHQVDMVRRVCEAYGIPVYSLPGYEADDLLGTFAEAATRQGYDVVIVTGDKDVLQLVGPRHGRMVTAYDPQKDLRLDPEVVLRERGVRPDQIVDFLGLAGDTSDDIPGVPGIGPKTAIQLLQKYGTLEATLEAAAAGKEKGKRRENLVQFAEQARLSRRLATISPEAPLEIDIERCRVGPGDTEKLIEVFQELGFRELLKSVVPKEEKAELAYHIVDEPEAMAKLAAALRAAGRFAFDTETDSVDPRQAGLVGLSFSWNPREAWYVPVRAPAGPPPEDVIADALELPAGECRPSAERHIEERVALAALGPILEDESLAKIGQNAKFDAIVLRRAGTEVRGLEFDTMVASYLLDPGSRSHGIDALSVEHLGFSKTATTEIIGKGRNQTTMDRVAIRKVGPYACEDADVCYRLAGILERRIEQAGLRGLFRELEMPLVEVLAEMEWNGIRVDTEALKALSEGMCEALVIEEKAIYEAAGREFAIASPKQLNEVLYEQLKLPVLKKTPKGQPSTDSDVLARLARHHPLPKLIVRYRELAKLKSTYADSLVNFVNPETGRIHASFHQTVTATGRLSSSDPNLQNIPVRSDEGRAVRQAFVPEPGWVFLSADYSQIELRLLAHISGDARLTEAFRAGLDIHTAVAAELGGIPLDAVDETMRRRAKTVNFGLMYGQGAQHLARTTGMSVEEAEEFIRLYFDRFEGVTRLKAEILERARTESKVSTLLGRVRHLPEINSDDIQSRRSAERMAFNTVIQGSAADLIKRAMIDLHRELKRTPLRARMLLQIHDELLLECPPEELETVRKLTVERMTGAADLTVPLLVDVGTGPNWLDLEYDK